MATRVIPVLLLLTLIVSCGTQSDQQKAVEVNVQALLDNAEQYVDKTVNVSGTVVHVCRHTGKRLFIVGENPEKRFKVVTGPNMSSFDVALEGSDVTIEGIVRVQKIDEAYLDQWESQMSDAARPEVAHDGEHKGEHQEEQASCQTESCEQKENSGHDSDKPIQKISTNPQIDELRKQLAESGKDYLAFYSLECVKIIEKKS